MLSVLCIKTFFSSSGASNNHRAWHNNTFKNARYACWTRHPARLLTWALCVSKSKMKKPNLLRFIGFVERIPWVMAIMYISANDFFIDEIFSLSSAKMFLLIFASLIAAVSVLLVYISVTEKIKERYFPEYYKSISNDTNT